MRLKQAALLLTVAGIAAAIIAYFVYRQPSAWPPIEPKPPAAATDNATAVYLYFGDDQSDYLTAETRSVFHAPGPSALGRSIVEALIEGPRSDRLRTIPKRSKLNAIYIDGTTAYLDFSKDVAVAHSGGAQMEFMTVYSIVNSLILNVAEIDQVKILIEGREATTLSGHIDLRRPLAADMLIVR